MYMSIMRTAAFIGRLVKTINRPFTREDLLKYKEVTPETVDNALNSLVNTKALKKHDVNVNESIITIYTSTIPGLGTSGFQDMVKATLLLSQAKSVRATKAPMSMLDAIKQLEEEEKDKDKKGEEDNNNKDGNIETDEAVKRRVEEIESIEEDREKYQGVCEKLLDDLETRYGIGAEAVAGALGCETLLNILTGSRV